MNTLYTDLTESKHIKDMNARTNDILDANYSKADIKAYMVEYSQLDSEHRNSLTKLLRKYEILFDGTLGKWKREPVSLRLKPNAKLCQSRQFSVPYFHQETFKNEIQRLVDIGVLKKNPGARYSSPLFIIPKKTKSSGLCQTFVKIIRNWIRHPFQLLRLKTY